MLAATLIGALTSLVILAVAGRLQWTSDLAGTVLLFLGGVMNLLWIAGLTLFVLLEKVIPHGLLAGRAAGMAILLAGVLSLVSGLRT